MSGWLRRLAGQATGTTSGIRPARALVSPTSAATTPPEISEETISSDGEGRTPAGHLTPQGPTSASAGVAPTTLPAPVVRPLGPRQPTALRFDDVLAHLATPRSPTPASGTTEVVSAAAPAAHAPHPSGPTRRTAQESLDDTSDHARPVTEPPLPMSATTPSYSQVVTVRPASPVVAAQPARAQPQPPAARDNRRAAAAEQQQTQQIAAPPPDVHIHIGRIEVSAVMPPAPQRRGPPAAAKPILSLDDYLQQRRKRS